MKHRRILRSAASRRTLIAFTALSLVALTGCSSSESSADSSTIKVAFQDYGSDIMANLMQEDKKDFEAANPGKHVTLVPIKAAENDYYTKLALMNRSASTAPDVLWEDTFLIRSDAQAGYLEPLDSYLDKWSDWSQFENNAKDAGKADDGKTYGIPLGTDTRALWYNKDIFAKAGLPADWKPKNWDDVLSAAKTIKEKVPGVTPINIYSGKAAGEASSMQGFEMLLYGADSEGLYDAKDAKWVVNSPAFTDSLTMLKDVYQNGLGLPPEVTSDANYQNVVGNQLIPQGKLAIDLDGSWLASAWSKGGATPWPQWTQTMGATPMPTKDGQAPGNISLAGGWTLSMGSKSKAKDTAWQFLAMANDKKHTLATDIALNWIAVRKDVAQDSAYRDSNPMTPFFSSLVANTTYRPATPDYPKISNAIQVAMESVMTGQASPEQAAKTYDDAVVGIVGKDKTVSK